MTELGPVLHTTHKDKDDISPALKMIIALFIKWVTILHEFLGVDKEETICNSYSLFRYKW